MDVEYFVKNVRSHFVEEILKSKENLEFCEKIEKLFEFVYNIQKKYPLECSNLELARNWKRFEENYFLFRKDFVQVF